jgi:cysteine desulfurase
MIDISQIDGYVWAICVIVLLVIIGYIISYRSVVDNDSFCGIYLDNNATMRPYDSVVSRMANSAYLGNGSATHANKARHVITDANHYLRTAFGVCTKWPVVWTSGASEANNLFIRGIIDRYWRDAYTKANISLCSIPMPHIILSSIEHKTSLEAVGEMAAMGRVIVTVVSPDLTTGRIEPHTVAMAIEQLKSDTTTPLSNNPLIAISIMHANNETGNINDVVSISMLAVGAGAAFHTDCAQSFGKMPPRGPWPAGLKLAISISMHKIGGPSGLGALLLSPALDEAGLVPQISGSQMSGRRGGTENIAAIAGAETAMRLCFEQRASKNERLFNMRNTIVSLLSDTYPTGDVRDYTIGVNADTPAEKYAIMMPGVGPNAPNRWLIELLYITNLRPNLSLPNTLLLSIVKHAPMNKHFCNIRLKADLAKQGVIVSIGSACNSKTAEPSHVLTAFQLPYIVRCGVIRISLGDLNTIDQCYEFVNKFARCVDNQIN